MPLSVRNSTTPRPGRVRDFRHGLLDLHHVYRTDRGGRHRCSHLPRACGGIARRHHRLIARPRNARADRVEHRLQHSGERAGCEGRRDCSDGTVTALAAACYGSLAALWTLLIQLARLGVLVRLRRYRNVCGLLPGRLRRSRLRCRKRTRAVWSWDCTAVRIARRRSWLTASTRRRGWTARSLVKRLVLGGSYMRWSLRGRLPERSAKVHGPRRRRGAPVTVRRTRYGHGSGPTGRWRCRRPAPVECPCTGRAPDRIGSLCDDACPTAGTPDTALTERAQPRRPPGHPKATPPPAPGAPAGSGQFRGT